MYDGICSSALGRWGGLGEEQIVLASALSHYAFFTDFILEETEREQQCIGPLRRRIETGTASDEAAVALFACYRPLYMLGNANRILETFKDNENLSDVVKAQIADHIFLRQLAVSIPTLMPVADETSRQVREQYEAFPYPRWKTISKHRVLENWRAEGSSQRLEGPLSNGPATLLIAGCGTGRDASIHAMRFPQASITAVDVSRTSLAYASMKAKEMGLENLTFMQGDILDLGRMGQRFDYICCTGVLHHMEEPLSGWRVLRRPLEPRRSHADRSLQPRGAKGGRSGARCRESAAITHQLATESSGSDGSVRPSATAKPCAVFRGCRITITSACTVTCCFRHANTGSIWRR